MRFVSLLPAILLLLALPASENGRLFAQSDHLDASLIIDVESIAPGVPFLAAASFTMEEQWHIYWRNPGDAGLATVVDWKLPEGFIVEELGWPIPHLFGEAPEVTYGYEGTVLLPVKITPPATLKPGTSVEISAAARWLVCKEACIPGRGTIKTTLPVESKPRPNVSAHELVMGTVKALPKVIGQDREIMVAATAANYVISVPDRYRLYSSGAISFLPYFESVVDHSAPQTIDKVKGATLIYVPRSTFATETAERLQGILVQPIGDPGVREALEVDLPVSAAVEAQNSK